jgi:hypothetical protein
VVDMHRKGSAGCNHEQQGNERLESFQHGLTPEFIYE